MLWNSNLYVVYGVVFNETLYSSGLHDYAIHKLLLIDPRFSGVRRETCFDRLKDDWEKVKGLLRVRAMPTS